MCILIRQIIAFKETKIFKNFCNEKLSKTEELSKKINYSNSKLVVDSTGQESELSKVRKP